MSQNYRFAFILFIFIIKLIEIITWQDLNIVSVHEIWYHSANERVYIYVIINLLYAESDKVTQK